MISLDYDSPEYIDLYVFGSAVYSENPIDIDIAIIYNKDKIGAENLIRFRKDLEVRISEITGCSVDSIVLSIEEEKEMEFLRNARHQKI